MTAGRKRVEEFLFPPAADLWLGLLRVGLGVQLLLYCWSLGADWKSFYRAAGESVISRELPEAILSAQSPFIPRVGWLVDAGARLGLGEDTVLTVAWVFLLASGGLLLVGLLSRMAAIAAWFLHLCLIKSGNLVTYGMDNFTTIGLFYLMLGPLPDRYALDHRIRGRPLKDRHLVGFCQRALQLHLSVAYFFSGLAKALGVGWWNGTSIWRALTCPPYDVLPTQVLLGLVPILPLVGATVCILELGYPFFIWPEKTRSLWLMATLGMHIAIGLTMGLYLFALIMVILNVAAFGSGLVSVPLTRVWQLVANRTTAQRPTRFAPPQPGHR